jgi:hypothetical protein
MMPIALSTEMKKNNFELDSGLKIYEHSIKQEKKNQQRILQQKKEAVSSKNKISDVNNLIRGMEERNLNKSKNNNNNNDNKLTTLEKSLRPFSAIKKSFVDVDLSFSLRIVNTASKRINVLDRDSKLESTESTLRTN